MTKTAHIMFGSESHRTNYARTMAVNPRSVILATHPDEVQALITAEIDTIKVVRFPEHIWTPSTHPCEKRAKETEGLIKGYRRLGVTIVEVQK